LAQDRGRWRVLVNMVTNLRLLAPRSLFLLTFTMRRCKERVWKLVRITPLRPCFYDCSFRFRKTVITLFPRLMRLHDVSDITHTHVSLN
jgi:hypothetical protein